ncbi:hypothetical protein B0H14DRAFT_2555774 [Mycena olivaceomarginata]|nr:hypothetical protein B0H14DRAFT_2555774 [Mycena olivaceomarginata]
MPPKDSETPKAVTRPPRELIARIEHLRDLLKNLPDTLPNNPPDSCYCFYLDVEDLDVKGYFGAAGHALEISFNTFALRDQPIIFCQRGTCLDDLTKMMKLAIRHMSPGERENFRTAWVERLVNAAINSGAKIPAVPSALWYLLSMTVTQLDHPQKRRRTLPLPMPLGPSIRTMPQANTFHHPLQCHGHIRPFPRT